AIVNLIADTEQPGVRSLDQLSERVRDDASRLRDSHFPYRGRLVVQFMSHDKSIDVRIARQMARMQEIFDVASRLVHLLPSDPEPALLQFHEQDASARGYLGVGVDVLGGNARDSRVGANEQIRTLLWVLERGFAGLDIEYLRHRVPQAQVRAVVRR